MDNVIFYYTGTGNSLWTARKLAEILGNFDLISMKNTGNSPVRTAAKKVGIIFPVHIWGLPKPVIDFIDTLEIKTGKYYFAIAVNAGQVAATLLQLQKLMKQRELHLAAGFSICLPSNYIPWGGAASLKKQQELFDKAINKINLISKIIHSGDEKPPEQGPLWQNIFLSALYNLTSPKVRTMDKSFWADDKCTGCRICQKICPAANIVISNDRPRWQHQCEQCFACLQWCPEEAIQYGRNTAVKKRYRHPEIKLADMMAGIPARSKVCI